MINETFEVVDKNGNTMLRRASDYLKPLTAFQLAQAFPEERALAIKRKRELNKILAVYSTSLSEVNFDSTLSSEAKYILTACIETWQKLDPAQQELNTLEAYLRMTKYSKTARDAAARGNPVKTEREILQIEQAKLRPLQELFNPENPRETSSTIMCCCPFHHERTPSFAIYKKSNKFHCFSCGEGGDSIHFYMKMHNVDFPTAVRALT